jgi:hypothetical protein
MRLRHCFVSLITAVVWAGPVLAAPDPQPPVPPAVPPAPAAPPEPAAPAAAPPSAPVETAPPPGATGKIDLHTQAPAPPVRRTDHVHDGFYLRMNAGLGYLYGTYDSDDSGTADNFALDLDGFALSFDALVGGSPSPGVAIGGGILTSAAPSAEVSVNDTDIGNRSIGFGIVGAFVDGFFNPRKGFHMGGMLGVARIDVEDNTESGDVAATGGVGGAAWLGWDFWVANQWSTGVLFRVAGALTRNGDEDIDASAVATSVMFTAVYH